MMIVGPSLKLSVGTNYRRRLMRFLIIAIVLVCSVNLYAQVELPPVVSDSLWVFNPSRSSDAAVMSTASFAVADLAGKIFQGTNSRRVFVQDSRTGERLDTIDISDYDTTSNPMLYQVYANDLGTVVELFWRTRVAGGQHMNASIIEYPSKREIKTVIRKCWINGPLDRYYYFGVSPSGRFAIVPGVCENMQEVQLYDITADRTYRLTDSGYSVAHGSLLQFSRNDSMLVVPQIPDGPGSQNTKLFRLHSGGEGSILLDSVGGPPQLSGDAKRYAVISYSNLTERHYKSLSVYDTRSQQMIWRITGSLGDLSINHLDFSMVTLNEDGTVLFANRNDTALTPELRTGLFYRLPDTVAFARTLPNTVGPFSGFNGVTVLSRDFTRAYYSPRSGAPFPNPYGGSFVAVRMDIETSVNDPGYQGSKRGIDLSEIYPNPSSGDINVRWNGTDQDIRWRLLDVRGREADSGSCALVESILRIQTSTSLPNGTYVLQLNVLANRTASGHVVIIRR